MSDISLSIRVVAMLTRYPSTFGKTYLDLFEFETNLFTRFAPSPPLVIVISLLLSSAFSSWADSE